MQNKHFLRSYRKFLNSLWTKIYTPEGTTVTPSLVTKKEKQKILIKVEKLKKIVNSYVWWSSQCCKCSRSGIVKIEGVFCFYLLVLDATA